tara:strand:- start:45 stop:485 length:441 start_codon:yes stop_codon:yes gene_type:complete
MKKREYKVKIDKLIKEKNFSELEDLCLHALINYEDSIFYYYLGVSQANLNKVELSIYNLGKAVFLQPDVSFFHSRLAYAYLKIGNLEFARDSLKRSIDLEPSNEIVYIDYLKTLYNLKDDDFLTQIENALKLFPNSNSIKKFKELK